MKNKRSKILSILVVLAMVLSLLPANLTLAATTTLKAKNLTVQVGKTVNIFFSNKVSSSTYSFTSSSKKIATVSKTGVIKGVKVGTAKITVKAVDKAKKSSTIGTVTVKVTKADAVPTKAPAAPAANSYKVDLSTVMSATYDKATDSVTAKDTLFQFPLKTPAKNGDSFTVTVKGVYNGSKGFRSWLIDDVQTTLSNVADTSVFPSKPGAFEVTYTLTSIGAATNLFFKGATYDAPNVDNVTITSITIAY